MPEWHPVTTIDQIPDESGFEAVVGDFVIAIFKVDGGFHAIDGICAHAGGPVAEGTIHGCIVTCPWHGWQYDVSTGRHCLNDLIQQTSYPVKVEEDQIFVEFP